MSDLYDRLEEIQGMTRALLGDVERLRQQLGSRSIQHDRTAEQEGARRAYVRAVFALIEATVEQHKRLLMDLASRSAVALDQGTEGVLMEQVFVADDKGKIGSREQYLSLRRKIRVVYRAAAIAYGRELAVRYDDQGWQRFAAAIEIRDRLTHPKSHADCGVGDEDLDSVDRGHEWYRGLNQEFVRAAREHRREHNW